MEPREVRDKEDDLAGFVSPEAKKAIELLSELRDLVDKNNDKLAFIFSFLEMSPIEGTEDANIESRTAFVGVGPLCHDALGNIILHAADLSMVDSKITDPEFGGL